MIKKKSCTAVALSFLMCMSGMVLPDAVWAQESSSEEIEVFVDEQAEERTGEEAVSEELSGDSSGEAEEVFSEGLFSAEEEAEEFIAEEAETFSDEAVYGATLKEEQIELNVKSGQNILSVLDTALKRAEKTTDVHYTIVIPPGNYTINGMIHVFSNTTIRAEGATITKTSGSKMIKAGTETYVNQHQTEGYDMFQNIEIIGGTWDNNGTGSSAIKFGHSSNIALRNMTILGNASGAHLLEVGGVDGLTVENCVFRGYNKATNKYLAQEAIEIECARSPVFSEYPPFNNIPSRNISITGCTFEDLIGGIGMHNAVYGNYTDQVTIKGNTFRNIVGQSIKMSLTRNLAIENNKFENVCAAMDLEALCNELAPQNPMEPYQADMNIRISDNTIKLAVVEPKSTYAPIGICLKGNNLTKDSNGVPKGIYKLSGVLVQNNTITGSGRGISLDYCDNCKILNNKISFSKSGTWGTTKGFPILLNNSSCGNLIKSCTIDDTYDDNEGIRIINASHNNTVQSCTIGGGKKYAIAVRNSDGTKLTSNKVSKRATGGICVDGAKSCQIISNRSESNTGYGLLIMNSKITRLEKNVFTGNKKTAMSVNNSTVPSGLKTLNAPTVGKVTSASVKVTGTAKGTAKVTVKAGTKTLGTASVKSNGTYTVKIPKQKKKTKLVITAADKKNNQVVMNTTVK